MSDRRQMIEQMLAENPDDTFLRYSLGMELAVAGQHEEAIEQFRQVIAVEPGYLAAYVEAAKVCLQAGRRSEARDLFGEAMEVAGLQGENHVQDYIRQQLNALGGAS